MSKYRQIARLEPVIMVEGTLQKHDGVVNVVAEHLRPIQHHRKRTASTDAREPGQELRLTSGAAEPARTHLC